MPFITVVVSEGIASLKLESFWAVSDENTPGEVVVLLVGFESEKRVMKFE